MSGYVPPRPDIPASAPASPQQWVYEGKEYVIGSTGGYWGIWPKHASGGPPIATFPQTQEGWRGAWERIQVLDADANRPFYRRGGGWVLVNIALGLACGFGLLFIDGIILATFGYQLQNPTPDIEQRSGGFYGLGFLAGLVGWLLFAYLRSPGRTRGWVLGGVYAGAVVVVAIGLSSIYPR